MIKRAVSIFCGLMAIVVLVPLGAYLSWPYWSGHLVQHLVTDYGVSIKSLELSRPSTSGLIISKLHLDYNLSGYHVKVRAPALAISYSLSSLLAGRLQRVQSSEINIIVHENPEYRGSVNGLANAPNAASTTPLAWLLPQHLFSQIPVDKLDIANISLESPLMALAEGLRGDISFDGTQLALTMASLNSTFTEFELQVNKDNSLTAHVMYEGETVANIQSRLVNNGHADTLRANAMINVGRVVELFSGDLAKHFTGSGAVLSGEVLSEQSLSGTVNATLSMPLPSLPSKLDSDGLHQQLRASQLRPVGSISSSGTFLIPQNEDGHYRSIAGAYDISGHYQWLDNHFMWISDTIRLRATPYLPLAYAAENPTFKHSPIAVQLDLQAGTKIKIHTKNGRFDVENIEGLANVSHKESALKTSVRVEAASFHFKPKAKKPVKAKLLLAIESSLNRLKSNSILADHLTLSTSATITMDGDQLTASSRGTTTLTAQKLRHGNAVLQHVKLKATAPITLHWQQGALVIPNANFVIDNQQLQIAEQQFSVAQAQVTLNNVSYDSAEHRYPAMELLLAIKDLGLRTPAFTLAPSQVSAALVLNNAALNGHFTVNTANALLSSQGRLQHNMATGKGHLSATIKSAKFSEQLPFIPQLIITPLPYPVDFSRGQILAEAQLHWNDSAISSSKAKVTLSDVSGFYQRNLFKKVETTLLINKLHRQMELNTEKFYMAELDAGLVISHLQMAVNVASNTLTLSDINAELLGGTASQKAIVYDWQQAENHFIINLQNLQLAQILALETGISGTGRLNGRLPIIISDKGVRVAKGQVNNLAPGGIINYTSPLPLGNSALDAGLKLTLEALKNFHYNVLKMQVDTDDTGNLSLAASLQGQNPDLEQQRPIHFNLNITENIPALLKSLQLTQKISDDLNQRIQSHVNASKQESLQ